MVHRAQVMRAMLADSRKGTYSSAPSCENQPHHIACLGWTRKKNVGTNMPITF
jgi:hypothetical protein